MLEPTITSCQDDVSDPGGTKSADVLEPDVQNAKGTPASSDFKTLLQAFEFP